MQIEITEAELRIIEEALELWQDEPKRRQGMTKVTHEMMGKMLPVGGRAEADRFVTNLLAEDDREIASRRERKTLLLARIYQTRARASEFAVEEEAP